MIEFLCVTLLCVGTFVHVMAYTGPGLISANQISMSLDPHLNY